LRILQDKLMHGGGHDWSMWAMIIAINILIRCLF